MYSTQFAYIWSIYLYVQIECTESELFCIAAIKVNRNITYSTNVLVTKNIQAKKYQIVNLIQNVVSKIHFIYIYKNLTTRIHP